MRASSVGSIRGQRGVALIVALLVLAIATGLAATMIVRNQNSIGATSALVNGARADELATSALALAQALLDRDDRNIDGPADAWAQPLLGIPVDQATMNLRVVDLQGRFNLNDLITSDDKVNLVAKQRFQTLLSTLGISTDISNAVIDWIDRNPNIEPLGAEDAANQGTSAYLPAGRPMLSVTELRAVRGVTDTIYRQLAPYVAALPVGTLINLNSAPAPVLTALGANPMGLTGMGTAGDSAPGAIQPKNIGSVADFLAQPMFAGRAVPADGLSVNSQYFLCAVTVHLDTVTRRRYAIIERPMSGPSRIIALSSEACLTGFYCL
jgi:general secretion pathway protein K